jgi:hypothetical protein
MAIINTDSNRLLGCRDVSFRDERMQRQRASKHTAKLPSMVPVKWSDFAKESIKLMKWTHFIGKPLPGTEHSTWYRDQLPGGMVPGNQVSGPHVPSVLPIHTGSNSHSLLPGTWYLVPGLVQGAAPFSNSHF